MYLKLLWNLYCSKKNTTKSAEQLQRLQRKKLNKLLRHAYRNSPYYRKMFEAAGISQKNLSTTPLQCFPVIDKETLLQHYDELVTDSAIRQEDLLAFDSRNPQASSKTSYPPTPFPEKYLGKYHIVHSSGSTGSARYFLYDDNAWEQMLLGIIRGALWGMEMPEILKLLREKPRILYIAATDGRYGGAMAVGDGVRGLRAAQEYLDINMPMEQWAKKIEEFHPNILIGYPSAIKLMAEQMQKQGTPHVIRRVISCGEPLSAELRAYLEQYFQCSVINFYGASEALALGLEIKNEEGMLLFDDLNIVEVIDGEMYVTCLYNYTQPLIRYHLTDKLKPRPTLPESPCHFSRADVLLCRSEDVMWFEREDGSREFLHPLSIEGLCVDGLLDYQFVQESETYFELHAQLNAHANKKKAAADIRALLTPLLHEKKLSGISYRIVFVNHILPEKETGKKKLIVRRVAA